MARRRKKAPDIAAQLDMLGVDWPAAPLWDGLIEGPFDFSFEITDNLLTAVEFFKGSDSAVSWDWKLNAAGFDSDTPPQGVLIVDAIGMDVYVKDNSDEQIFELLRNWSFVYSPATVRKAAMGFKTFSRVSLSTAIANDGGQINDRWGAGQHTGQIVPMIGGPWAINTQQDNAQFKLKDWKTPAGVNLATKVGFNGQFHGAYLTWPVAQALGAVDGPESCPNNAAFIAQVMQFRRAMPHPRVRSG